MIMMESVVKTKRKIVFIPSVMCIRVVFLLLTMIKMKGGTVFRLIEAVKKDRVM